MDQTTLEGDNLSELRAEYDSKVHAELPELARAEGGWPIRSDHCFARVVLDNAFEDEWYDHVDGRPAYKHLSAAELAAAIEIADRMLDGGPQVAAELNERSLEWRSSTA